jgi:hypothetical protein
MNTPLLVAIALAIPLILVVGFLAGDRFVQVLNARPKLWRAFASVCALGQALLAFDVRRHGQTWWPHAISAGVWLLLVFTRRKSAAV